MRAVRWEACFLGAWMSAISLKGGPPQKQPIDRKAVVSRHVPTVTAFDSLAPFTVGNGTFAFTVDITGLQTFPEAYSQGIPLCTLSEWGWHTFPTDTPYTLEDTHVLYATHGRKVAYASLQNSDAGRWLRANPHRLPLGWIGFRFLKKNGEERSVLDLRNLHQRLDLWEGIIHSHFELDSLPVSVETACHPKRDHVAVRVVSSLLQTGRVGIVLSFPFPSGSWGPDPADWNHPERHTSRILSQTGRFVQIERRVDSTRYEVALQWKGKARFRRIGAHAFLVEITGGEIFEAVFAFSPKRLSLPLPDAKATIRASRRHWQTFWKRGGAVDFSGSLDPRAFELERRIVLSRYLTAVQCAGIFPPQETGLTCTSWHGKFHHEMHWWHGVHFVLWGHPEILEKSMAWYQKLLPLAQKEAERQGYRGARWPKMTGPEGRESPSRIGVFLIWQQPHPIYLAELLYRVHKKPEILDGYRDIVFASAEFLASYAHWDSSTGRYVLGPPLIPAQEIYGPEDCLNPTFELAYWTFGLETAQEWRKRLGLPEDSHWGHVLKHLSTYPVANGLYQNAENAMETFEDSRHRNDHPMLLGAYGMIPGKGIDPEIMENTLEKVLQTWDWESTWGWDYPLMAMTATRLSRPDFAIEALLMESPKNRYLANGHNNQGPSLPVYLPGNGALLTAVAMMAAGWEGGPKTPAPGFPKNGLWKVRYEGLMPLL